MNLRTSFLLASLSALLCFVSGPAYPGMNSGEEEALINLDAGKYPLAVSPDGRWLFRVDAGNVLYREPISGDGIGVRIQLPRPVKLVSVSRTGKTLALADDAGCVGIIAFADGSPPPAADLKLDWLDLSRFVPGFKRDRCLTQGPGAINPDLTAIAISGDGSLLAIPGDAIRVIDIVTGELKHEIPTGLTYVHHLRFLDGDRKLLVIQALMGEGHDAIPDTDSEMQFAIWDLEKRELANFHNIRTGFQEHLGPHDWLWNFSESTGELWTIGNCGISIGFPAATGQQLPPNGQPSLYSHTTKLKDCAAEPQERVAIPCDPDSPWLEFAADPRGRWIANVTPVFNGKEMRLESRLSVRDSGEGKILAEWPVTAELRSLTASPDGSTLYGITGGQPKPEQLDESRRSSWTFTGGGELMKFDLTGKIAGLQPQPPAPWAQQRCLLENEEAQARDITVDKTERPRLWELPLGEHKHRGKSTCPGTMNQDSSTSWCQMEDGNLWLDRGSTLESIAPAEGTVRQRIPTPRSNAVSSLPLYGRRQFLSWQGDTVSLRPFAEELSPRDRKILVRKPGWLATDVVWLGDRIGVRWVNSRYQDQGDHGEHEEGSALAIVYDLSGKPLAETRGRAVYGQARFTHEEYSDEDVFSEYLAPTLPPAAPYGWELSYMGSIRAEYAENSGNDRRTVLWQGLKLGDTLPPVPSSFPTKGMVYGKASIQSLGGSLGAYVSPLGVRVFDAATRRQLAFIEMKRVAGVAWNPAERVLLIQADSTDGPSRLYAYRID